MVRQTAFSFLPSGDASVPAPRGYLNRIPKARTDPQPFSKYTFVAESRNLQQSGKVEAGARQPAGIGAPPFAAQGSPAHPHHEVPQEGCCLPGVRGGSLSAGCGVLRAAPSTWQVPRKVVVLIQTEAGSSGHTIPWARQAED